MTCVAGVSDLPVAIAFRILPGRSRSPCSIGIENRKRSLSFFVLSDTTWQSMVLTPNIHDEVGQPRLPAQPPRDLGTRWLTPAINKPYCLEMASAGEGANR